MSECTAIVCGDPATLAIDVTIRAGKDREPWPQQIPYCDKHFGWFYRSLARKSYDTEVNGVTILLDVDDQFNSLYKS